MYLLFSIFYRTIDILSLCLAAYALLSWFPGAYQTTFGQIVATIAEPILKPFRRLNLQFGGLDWTVWVAILTLNALSRLVNYLLIFLL